MRDRPCARTHWGERFSNLFVNELTAYRLIEIRRPSILSSAVVGNGKNEPISWKELRIVNMRVCAVDQKR